MGLAKERPTGELRQVALVRSILTTISDFLRTALALVESTIIIVTEYERLRDSARAHKTPLDFEEFKEMIAKTDLQLADLMQGLKVEKFDMGRLIAALPPGHDGFLLELRKGSIEAGLKRAYGHEFSVRLKK